MFSLAPSKSPISSSLPCIYCSLILSSFISSLTISFSPTLPYSLNLSRLISSVSSWFFYSLIEISSFIFFKLGSPTVISVVVYPVKPPNPFELFGCIAAAPKPMPAVIVILLLIAAFVSFYASYFGAKLEVNKPYLTNFAFMRLYFLLYNSNSLSWSLISSKSYFIGSR